MKYKVGDRFLVEIEIKEINEDDRFKCPYKMTYPYGRWREEALDKLRRPDGMTAEEAWEIARKLCNMERGQRMVILGNKYYHMDEVYEDFTPQQIKAKIEAWEEGQQIKVGDVVYIRGDKEFLITAIMTGREYPFNGIILDTGETTEVNKNGINGRTDRHIDVQSVLDQIGGEPE